MRLIIGDIEARFCNRCGTFPSLAFGPLTPDTVLSSGYGAAPLPEGTARARPVVAQALADFGRADVDAPGRQRLDEDGDRKVRRKIEFVTVAHGDGEAHQPAEFADLVPRGKPGQLVGADDPEERGLRETRAQVRRGVQRITHAAPADSQSQASQSPVCRTASASIASRSSSEASGGRPFSGVCAPGMKMIGRARARPEPRGRESGGRCARGRTHRRECLYAGKTWEKDEGERPGAKG